jgi:c(7)-type cytochrome triheme protein
MGALRRALIVVPLALALSAATAVAGFLGDITMNRISTANGVPAVVFPHWKHRIQFRCYACHPDVFEMQSGTNEITMETLREGAFCARCHDGRTAWAISFDTCRVCHSLGEM